MAETGFLLNFFNAFGADASGWLVDNPLEGQIVVWLQNDAEIGEGVADFRALIELRAADDLIGNGFGNKFFFKFAGLKSCAYQNRHVGVLCAVAQMIVDLVDDIAGFVFAVVITDNLDFGVVAVLRRRVFGDFEGFAQAAVVVADEAGSCGQNVCRRAVIALKADGLGVVKVFFKAQNVFDFGAAPGINRLVVVADAAEVAAFLAQQAQKKILGNVGVLILVDHDVFELGLVFVKHVGIGEQDVQRIEENVAEVDAVELKQAFLIFFVKVSQDVFFIFVLDFVDGQSFVLPAADFIQHGLRRVFLVVDAFGFRNLFDDALLVVFGENREIGVEADQFGVVAQNFDTDAVESSQPDGIGDVADHFLHAFFHFASGAVGKGNDQAVPRLCLTGSQNIGQTGGQHFGFAGAEPAPGLRWFRRPVSVPG